MYPERPYHRFMIQQKIQAQEAAASSVGLDLGPLDPGALGLGDLRELLG